MQSMRKHLFLYLTLLCFVGLIAIFIVDGWMGVYDTVYITTGEYEQRIEPDSWLQQEKSWAREARVNRGERAFFRYEIENHECSSHEADIEVSVWHSQEKVRDVLSQPMQVSAFDTAQLEWVVNAEEFVPEDIPPEQSYQFTVIMKRGQIERSIVLWVNPSAYPEKAVPAPAR